MNKMRKEGGEMGAVLVEEVEGMGEHMDKMSDALDAQGRVDI